jgi:hypothetical protein
MPERKAQSKARSRELASFIARDAVTLVEATFDADRQPPLQFEVWKEGPTDGSPKAELLCKDGSIVVPPSDKHGLLDRKVVLLPSCPSEYGSDTVLVAEIVAFIHRYADIPPFWEQLIAHYAMMSWVFDRFTAVPYLRFIGEPQSGKSRCVQVAGRLCYKAIVAGGATSASPMFRLMDVWRGTFVIDEADYKSSDLWSEIIKILNSGYMCGMVVLRSDKSGDGYEPRAFDPFGPKILSTRKEFEDHALETRCLTLRTTDRKIRPDVPRQLPPAFEVEAQELRNKLLRWRFENFFKIQADESQLLHLEPRLTQIGTPLYAVSQDDGFRAELLNFLAKQADDQKNDRPQAIVAEAIRYLTWNVNVWPITLTAKEVADKAAEVSKDWGTADPALFSPKRTGCLVRGLGFEPRRVTAGYQFSLREAVVDDLIKRYGLMPRGQS